MPRVTPVKRHPAHSKNEAMSNSQKLLFTTAVFLLIGFGGYGIYTYSNMAAENTVLREQLDGQQLSVTSGVVPKEESTTTISSAKGAVTALMTGLKEKFATSYPFTRQEGTLWWTGSDESHITVVGPSLTTRIKTDMADTTKTAKRVPVKILNEFVQPWFTAAGFKKNVANTEDSDVGYALAFEKNGTLCKVQADASIYESGDYPVPGYNWTVTCADAAVYLQAHDYQLPILKAMKNGKDMFITFIKKGPNAVTVNASSGLGGFMSILKNTGDKWVEVYTGQDLPLCTDLKKNTVPLSGYDGKCVDTNGKEVAYRG